ASFCVKVHTIVPSLPAMLVETFHLPAMEVSAATALTATAQRKSHARCFIQSPSFLEKSLGGLADFATTRHDRQSSKEYSEKVRSSVEVQTGKAAPTRR